MKYKLIFLLSLLLLVSCSSVKTQEIKFSNPDGKSSPTIKVELALSNAERMMGLMYRKKMDQDSGMLFVFPDQDKRTFWMRNTYIPLDMIFVADNKKVVSVIENATPLTDTQRASEGPAKYVVEINSGLAKTWGITKGSMLEGELPESKD